MVKNKGSHNSLKTYRKIEKKDIKEKQVSNINKKNLIGYIKSFIFKKKYKPVFISIIFIGFIFLTYFSRINENLGTDKEVAKIQFAENIGFANSLHISITPKPLERLGANYEYYFKDIRAIDSTKESILTIELMKRLPDNGTINCYKVYNNTQRMCKRLDPPFNYYPNDSGTSGPIVIEENLIQEGTDLVLNYTCKTCNPGAFELEIDEPPRVSIPKYTFELIFPKYGIINPLVIENIVTANIYESEIYSDNQHIVLRGDNYSLKNSRTNSFFFQVYAKNFFWETIFVILISVIGGIVAYCLGEFFNKFKKA